MDDFIPTRGSQIKKHSAEKFVLVTHESRKRVKKSNNRCKISDETTAITEESNNMNQQRKQEIEMKRIRYEVIKFGMSGFKKTEADKAKVQLAINLGAKPPKNRNMNYKELKKQREVEKKRQKNKERISGLENSMIKHTSKKKISKVKKASGILDVYGKVNKKLEGKKKR